MKQKINFIKPDGSRSSLMIEHEIIACLYSLEIVTEDGIPPFDFSLAEYVSHCFAYYIDYLLKLDSYCKSESFTTFFTSHALRDIAKHIDLLRAGL